ncbi:MAG: 4Fe-4S ferredoxin [Sphaerochaeta sp.]|nr:4Fe-4S ferredoxin [uncultured Sphaerochaeta sp.]MDD3058906.1 4Fe-4S ferredoxin [Sphaerochaeta sp.]MDD3928597.1 4Fe-4S ferredoxin [Sphaerochaeta sp.]NCC12030.1 4Fe-4S ferredoxin [Spirochaetia bacterium]NCC90004.1 4Fe-4S ferredoxin [Spirochaetia bacterium]
MHAARNIALCTKDCVCLFVCPTGATDTENGQIDFSKCLSGCRLCVDACPSHAIYLVPSSYPDPQKKESEVQQSLFDLASSKVRQESIAKHLAAESDDPVFKQLCKTVAMSNHIMAEDCYREAGYILPQSDAVRKLLTDLLSKEKDNPDFPATAVKKLLEKL